MRSNEAFRRSIAPEPVALVVLKIGLWGRKSDCMGPGTGVPGLLLGDVIPEGA